jgi:hypothetical protein
MKGLKYSCCLYVEFEGNYHYFNTVVTIAVLLNITFMNQTARTKEHLAALQAYKLTDMCYT